MWFTKVGVYALAIVVFMVPFCVSAHATPISYTPTTGSTVVQVPASISIHFSERIEMGASSIKIFGPDGTEVTKGKGYITGEDGRTYTADIVSGGEGVYTTSWQVVSVDDGHFTKGANSFLVDATGKKFEGDAGGTPVSYVTPLSIAIFDFFNLIGESIFIALVIFLVCIVKPIVRRKSDVGSLAKFVPIFLYSGLVGALCITAGVTATFLKKAGELGDFQDISLFQSALIFAGSSIGFALICKFAIAIFFVCILFFTRRKIFNTVKITLFEIALIVGTCLLMYFQSTLSHAAASLFHPMLSIVVTAFHLFAKELVIGGALILYVLVLVALRGKNWDTWRTIIARYDALAALGILIAGITGVFVTWLHLKSPANIFLTEWGMRFTLLLLFTLMLGAFRLFHQFIIGPRLGTQTIYEHIFKATFLAEILVGLVVLFFSGYISITTPPFTVEQFSFVRNIDTEGIHVVLATHPYESRSFKIVLSDAVTREPITPNQLVLTATNEEKNIGPNVITLERRKEGEYVFPRADLSPAGTWTLEAIIVKDQGYDGHAGFAITYPDDVLATRYSDDVRSYNSFATLMIIIAIMIVCMSLVLLGYALYEIGRRSKDTSVVVYAGEANVPPLAITITLFAVVLFSAFLIYDNLIKTDFQHECVQDGFVWKQAFPARDLEAVSPNALSGCSIHGGHYHFIDQGEYRAYLDAMHERSM